MLLLLRHSSLLSDPRSPERTSDCPETHVAGDKRATIPSPQGRIRLPEWPAPPATQDVAADRTGIWRNLALPSYRPALRAPQKSFSYYPEIKRRIQNRRG